MKTDITLVECPRDAWQGLRTQIPAEAKAGYLRALIAAGFKHIDAVSFVSSTAVPQMADSEEVLKQLAPPEDVDIIGIVVNEKGAQRAINTNAIRTLGFPYSVSPTFLMRQQQQTLEEAYDAMEKIKQTADEAGLDMLAYISMAFGNSYGDLWNPDEVIEAVGIIEQMGIVMVSLVDSMGVATEESLREVVGAVAGKYSGIEIGVHLHSRPGQAVDKIVAAYEAGARRFDAAIGGLGGCAFAPANAQLGNIPTERLLDALARLGIESPLTKPLDELVLLSADLATKYKGAAV